MGWRWLIRFIGFKNTIEKFSKIAGYKVNVQKSPAFLCTDNEISEDEMRIQFSLQLQFATKRVKCLGISITKEEKGLYTENYKVLSKEIEKDIIKWTVFMDWKN